MDLYRGFDLDRVTEDPRCKTLIKKFFEVYDLVHGMKDFYGQRGIKPVIDYVSGLYDSYVKDGVDDVNVHTVRIDAYHFVGDQLDSGNVELSKAIVNLVDAIKKNFTSTDVGEKEKPHHRRKRTKKPQE